MTACSQRFLHWARVVVPEFLLGLSFLALALYVLALAARISWVLAEKVTGWVF